MEAPPKRIKEIEKESLANIKFSKNDVLLDEAKRRLRNIYLKKAELLGNSYKGKVKMVIQTEMEELVCVETTIWYVSDTYISVKGGINIPTKAICGIEF